MRKTITKTLSLLCMLCIIICSAFTTVGAASYPNDVKTESDSILLVNMDSGQTVYEKDADSKRYPASTTKIMTYIIAVENIADLDNTKIPIKQSVLDVLKNTGSSLANVVKTLILQILTDFTIPTTTQPPVICTKSQPMRSLFLALKKSQIPVHILVTVTIQPL